MPDRSTPYGAFNFLVNINGPRSPTDPLGGFSDVTGLSTDLTIAEYRYGNDRENHVRKVPGLHKIGDVTLKRGIVDSGDLWDWISLVRVNGINSRRDVVITLRDEAGRDVQSWTLRNAVPMKYTGPTLAAKGSSDVALEELVLSAEAIEFQKIG